MEAEHPDVIKLLALERRAQELGWPLDKDFCYEVAAQRFDGGGTIETVDSLHNGYLCDACAQKAATVPKLLAALDQYPARCDCSSDEQHYGRIMVWYCMEVAPLLEVVDGRRTMKHQESG